MDLACRHFNTLPDTADSLLAALRRTAAARAASNRHTAAKVGLHIRGEHFMRTIIHPCAVLLAAACALHWPAAAQEKPAEKPPAEKRGWTMHFSEYISTGNGTRVQGSGNVIEQVRQVGSFKAVRLDGPIDVKLRAGNAESVTVRTDDNLAQMIETTVENGVLVVNLKKNAAFRTKSGLQVLVDFKELHGAAIKGSGDMVIDRVQSEKFDASISGSGDLRVDQLQTGVFTASVAGSGDMTVAGAAQRQVISVAGSGNVQAKRLSGKDVKVSIAGSGDVMVNAADSLDVTIAGSGDVSYLGSPPRISKSIAGSGEVVAAK
jgi:hypothetical protein